MADRGTGHARAARTGPAGRAGAARLPLACTHVRRRPIASSILTTGSSRRRRGPRHRTRTVRGTQRPRRPHPAVAWRDGRPGAHGAGPIVARPAPAAPRRAHRQILEDESGGYSRRHLATLVNVACGSYTKAGVDQARVLDSPVPRGSGRRSRCVPSSSCGLVGTLHASRARAHLLIGHLDTVFPEDAGARPFRIEAGIARTAPASRTCCLAGLYALLALRALGPATTMPSTAARVRGQPGDEEIGSPSSAALESDAPLRPPNAPGRGRSRRHNCASRSAAGPPTPASSPRRGATPCSEAAHQHRDPGPERPLAGGHRQRWGDPWRDAANVVAEEAGLKSTSSWDSLEAAEAACGRSPRRPRWWDTTAAVEQSAADNGSSGSGRLVEHAVALAERLAKPPWPTPTGRRVRCEHDLGSGNPDPRRPGTSASVVTCRPRTSRSTRVPRTPCGPCCCWRCSGLFSVVASWRPHRA